MTNSSSPQDSTHQTSASLTDERGRADESHQNQDVQLENETDIQFKLDRKIADEARAERRAEADKKMNQARKELSANGKSTEDTMASQHVLSEREAEDEALQVERLAVDKALDSERSEKDTAFRNFIDQARESTDKNLTAEKAAHSTTRSELTTREEFLSIVSHDLRNPIGTISSCADMLLGEYSTAQVSDEARHWLKIIERNAVTALRLIEDILDIERIAEGKLSVKVARHGLSDIIRESIENYFQISVSKSITLKAVPTTFMDKALCDRDRINQVLTNLIGNAMKFTPAGGRITIKVEDLHKELRVCVSDTGCGIAADKKEHIFKRFAQIENKDRRGLGLGLYISKMLIESHNGKLWVESKAGEGCSFYFTLPKAD